MAFSIYDTIAPSRGIPLQVDLSTQNSNLNQGPLPAVGDMMAGYMQGQQAYQNVAKNLQAIKDAKQAHDQRGEIMDMQKKKADMDLQLQQKQGQITQSQADLMRTLVQHQQDQQSALHDAQGTMIDATQAQHEQAADQIKQSIQANPIHQILQLGGPQTFQQYAQQNPASQSLQPGIAQTAPSQSMPVIPVGGAGIAQSASQQQETPWYDQARQMGIDPSVIAKQTGMYMPPAITPEQQQMMEYRKDTYEQKRQDMLDKRQDGLEKQYTDRISKVLSNRSGGLGLQDGKVNQAIHLRNLLDQYYDPNTGEYSVPKSQYEELAMGLANLISPSSQATEGMRNGIIQKTAKGDINGAIAYITGGTPAASTQAVFKNLEDSINRQGLVSEQLRDKYITQLRGMVPSGIDQERAANVTKEKLGNSYKEALQNSPAYVAKKVDVNSFISNAKAHGYTDAQIQEYLKGKK